ncbi:MAG: hypothetical protein U9N49_03450, partial [Campylobacterota bacterium]|nr:hypothetical protein [Campylobacterota bacterium]
MKKLQKIALISVTLASLLSLNAVAQESKPNFNQSDCVGKNCYNNKGKRGMYNNRGHRNPMMRAIGYLDLSKEQRAALKELRKTQRDTSRAYRQANRMQGNRAQIFVDALSKKGLNSEILMTKATKRFQAREA